MVGDELVQVAAGVRDEAELEAVRAQLRERRQDVLEDLEVVRVLPGPGHLDCAFVGALGSAAHAPNDLLGEQHPDLLVVVELRMPLERRDGVRASLAVALRVELEPEALAEPTVALRPEIRTWLGNREVDVEENGAQSHRSCL